MSTFKQKCSHCGKIVFRDSGRMNESKKRGWKVFCSNRCLGLSRLKRKEFRCANPNCNIKFFRNPSDSLKSKYYYCSLRCAALVNNKRYPRDHGGIVKICAYCGIDFKSREKYCSRKCKNLSEIIPSEELIDLIKKFVQKNKRIPYKRELGHYSAFRARFGTWNKAMETAGFEPKCVRFSKKYIANDGDKCDSFAEKIIDDYLFARKIKHVRNFPYPGDRKFTVDFKIGDFWVEFFGLCGHLKRYDELMSQKLELVGKYKLKLVRLYLSDLLPKNKLSEKLVFVK